MSNGSATPNSEPDLPASGPGSRARRRFFLISFGVLCVVVLTIARDVLLPFLFAVVLAYVLSPVVDWGERLRIFGRQPQRWAVVVVLYLGLISGLVGVVTFSVPRLAAELSRLAREAPRIAAQARTEWIPAIARRVRETSSHYLGPLDAQVVPAREELGPAPAPASPVDPTAIQVRPR